MNLMPGVKPQQARRICSEVCKAQCCRGNSVVWLSDDEASRLQQMRTVHVRQGENGRRYMLHSDQPDERCPFLTDGNLCSIYDERPDGCRDFPYQWTQGCYISGGGYPHQNAATFLALPAGQLVYWESHANLLNVVAMGYAQNFVHRLMSRNATRLDENRNRIIEEFLKSGARFLVMLDADMIYPDDVVKLLTRHDAPVVGGLYFHRGQSFPIVYRYFKDAVDSRGWGLSSHYYKPMVKEVASWLVAHGVPPSMDYGWAGEFEDSLLECDHTGVGCIAIRRDVLERLQPPWFRTDGGTAGDINFGWRVRNELGEPIYTDMSIICGHLRPEPRGHREFMTFWAMENQGETLQARIGLDGWRMPPLGRDAEQAKEEGVPVGQHHEG